jgi:ATP-dependent RNA helicase DDX6/DHH1
MSDQLAEKLRASTISDNSAGSSSEDWKKNLNIPTKDGRHQTEVGPGS